MTAARRCSRTTPCATPPRRTASGARSPSPTPRWAGSPTSRTSRSAAASSSPSASPTRCSRSCSRPTVIFLTSFPIAYYSAKYSIDMDLITRGAGFGYFGGSVTSLIYASFTFIFFALEGSIMAQGLHLGLGLPLWLGYAVSALMIPPLVIFGMTLLSKMQMWTQPLWLVGMFLPFIVIAIAEPEMYEQWTHYGGVDNVGVLVHRARRGRRHRALADRPDRRAGRLPALHAGQDQGERARLVGGRDRRRSRLGHPRRAQAARRRVPRLLRDR